jgi:hypothetical protein
VILDIFSPPNAGGRKLNAKRKGGRGSEVLNSSSYKNKFQERKNEKI